MSLTLRLICGYLLRSLLPFLTCIYETLLNLRLARRVAVSNRGLGGAGLVFEAGQPYTASVWASVSARSTAQQPVAAVAASAGEFVLVAALHNWRTNTTLVCFSVHLRP